MNGDPSVQSGPSVQPDASGPAQVPPPGGASGTLTIDGTTVPVYTAAAAIPWYHRGWAKALAGVLILGSGLVIGWLLHPIGAPAPAAPAAPPASAEDSRLLDLQKARNDQLKASIAALEDALKGDVCKLDPAALERLYQGAGLLPVAPPDLPAPPSSATPTTPGTPDGQSGQSGQSGAVTPPAAPGNPATPPAAGSTAALADRLEKATVIILTDSASGSGFFIAPDTIITNAHVINEAKPGSIRVTSRTIGRLVPAQLAAKEYAEETGGLDFALLKVPAQPTAEPLALSTSIAKLSPVIAAGYPGIYLELDAQFNEGGIPELVLQRGEVSVIQEYVGGIPSISHTASLYQGNSGGPLVDTCGRVVGVNSFVFRTADDTTPAQIGYSLGTQALRGFIGRHGASAKADDGACQAP